MMDESGQRRLVVATTNQGKLAEFRRLLPPEFDLLTLAAVRLSPAAETGDTFEANARLKAVHAATNSGHAAVADDSGLEVDALAGAPGIRSARYSGDAASDEQNVAALLNALKDVAPEKRGARFRCVVALATPDGAITTSTGTCEGAISHSARGDHGFGYDPIFLLPDGRTMAQVPPEEKNRISHRAQAYRAILPSLLAAFGYAIPEECGGHAWFR